MTHQVLTSGGFGSDVTVPLEDSAEVDVNALRIVTSLVTSTHGAAESQVKHTLLKANVSTDVMTYGFDLATYPAWYIGNPAGRTGIRLQGSALELILSGTAYLQLTGTTVNFPTAFVTLQQRISEKDTTGTVSTNTLTLGTAGNLIIVSGTPTLNGIATSGVQSGYRGRIRLAAGSSINHNSGAPGSGAVAILTPTAATIGPTGSSRTFPISYDGTNFTVEG